MRLPSNLNMTYIHTHTHTHAQQKQMIIKHLFSPLEIHEYKLEVACAVIPLSGNRCPAVRTVTD